MGWFQIQEPDDIAGIIEELISERADLMVRIRRVGLPCSSKLLAILPALEPQRPSDRSPGRLGLLIEDLTPKHGDDLIQDFPEVDIRFGIHEYGGRFRTNYQGISSHYPHYGLTLDFPGSVALQEASDADGFGDDALRPFAAVLRVAAGSRRARIYELPVISWSECGLGLLVTAEDDDLVTLLEQGERIPEITLFAESGLLVLEGVVRHKWKVEDGIQQRSHILDLEIRAEEDGFTQPSDFSSPWARKTPEKGLSIA
jgi:hypothetical protein